MVLKEKTPLGKRYATGRKGLTFMQSQFTSYFRFSKVRYAGRFEHGNRTGLSG